MDVVYVLIVLKLLLAAGYLAYTMHKEAMELDEDK
jgi:hypothetical protein